MNRESSNVVVPVKALIAAMQISTTGVLFQTKHLLGIFNLFKIMTILNFTDFSISSLLPDEEPFDKLGIRSASPFISTLRLART